ncbi:SURF1 family protein [Caulobacter sp. S45]|uniref:SURF1 family protein n=1 Tax=Caulobacter sp. S45 TaxID=1641861 RepID=UPI0020C740D2|nr:SURF1 family protein [Caulobacter sp. S45]
MAILGLCLCLGFTVLGTWQLYRRAWKLNLIAQVQSRIHAPPQAAPGTNAWSKITAAADMYRRVRMRGVFLNDKETRVHALTELGGGYWVLTPLRAQAGFMVLVNRGFVPFDHAAPATRLAGQITGSATVTGLLRVSEPRGSFIQRNDPAGDRWYSRDVEAIAAAHHLGVVAPYFIDADSSPNPGGWPVGGLTVISFPNSHLVYAITWYALALVVLGAGGIVGREEWLRRKRVAACRPSV